MLVGRRRLRGRGGELRQAQRQVRQCRAQRFQAQEDALHIGTLVRRERRYVLGEQRPHLVEGEVVELGEDVVGEPEKPLRCRRVPFHQQPVVGDSQQVLGFRNAPLRRAGRAGGGRVRHRPAQSPKGRRELPIVGFDGVEAVTKPCHFTAQFIALAFNAAPHLAQAGQLGLGRLEFGVHAAPCVVAEGKHGHAGDEQDKPRHGAPRRSSRRRRIGGRGARPVRGLRLC